MRLIDVQLGGLSQLNNDSKITLDSAFICTDCVTDDDGVQPRNGYRKVSASVIGSGQTQGLWRYRPSQTSARTIVVMGGHVYTVTDPSSETASDGIATDLGALFGTTENVSGAQLGKYFYLMGDLSGSTMYRIDPSYAATAYTTLPTPAQLATPSDGTLSYIQFSTVAGTIAVTGAMAASGQFSNTWYNLAGNIGDTATYTLYGADQDWSTVKWFMLACSPETQSGGGGTFKVELGTNGGTFESLAVISDTPGDGSPFVAYFDLSALTTATRSAIRKIRFTNMGPTTDPFSIGGWMVVPQPPTVGQADYYVTYYHSSTLLESQLSPALTVVYSTPTTFPTFHAAQWYGNSFNDLGTRSVNPDVLSFANLWNKGTNQLFPLLQEFAAVKSFSVPAPAGAYDTIRLWRVTPTGVRLVKSAAATPGGANVSIRDDQGDTTLMHQLYKQSGGPPAATAMAAVSGRLVMGGLKVLDPTANTYPNRMAISSFLPFGSVSDPFPQFPAFGIQDYEGSFFDIAPSAAEGILAIGEGDDAAYILTNSFVKVMQSLTPGSKPYKIFQGGVIGRRAWCWAEDMLFWANCNGVFFARNRSQWGELTLDIRRLWNGTFVKTDTGLSSAIVVTYQDRKLYVQKETKQLRYDFVKKRWSGPHTLAHSMEHGAFWLDPPGSALSGLEQMWWLASDGNVYRWQPGHSTSDAGRATTDGGTTIPNWVYQTGYAFEGQKSRQRTVFCETVGGTVTITLYKNSMGAGTNSVTFNGEHQHPYAPDTTAFKWAINMTGGPAVFVRRVAMEREGTSGEGA